MDIDISRIFADHLDVVRNLEPLIPDIKALANRFVTCIEKGGTVFWMGNGGSAADSQHLAAEFVGRFRRERTAFASVALTTDTSALTAVSNDYGFEVVFRRQVEALCKNGDVIVGISTSGNSENIIQAVEAASKRGAYTVGFTGCGGGQLIECVDTCLSVPAKDTARIQEAHILIGHVLCEQVEQKITSKP